MQYFNPLSLLFMFLIMKPNIVFVIKYKDGYGNANLKILRTQKQ